MKPQKQACRDLAFAVETYLDGELEPGQIVEVESHAAHCPACRERVALDRAVRTSLQQIARPAAPSSLRERLEARLEAERLRAEAPPSPVLGETDDGRASFPARYAAPFAMAAGVALFFSVQHRDEKGAPSPRGVSCAASLARTSTMVHGA